MSKLSNYNRGLKDSSKSLGITNQVELKSIGEKFQQVKQRNMELTNELNNMNISERDIEAVGDQRNIFQKLLNLKDNQGLITGTLALMSRPAEAIQGAIASSYLGEDVATAAYAGLSGNKEYGLKDLGIEFDNPLVNAIANMSFEVAADPFNFMNFPIASWVKKGKGIMSGLDSKVAMFASRTPAGQDIYNTMKQTMSNISDGFKKTFGTWNNTSYQDFNNNVANVHTQSKNGVQEARALNLEFATQLNDFTKSTLDNWNDLPNQREIRNLLDLDDNFSTRLNSVDNGISLTAREEYANKLNSVLGALIETNMSNGINLGDLSELLLDSKRGVYYEVAAKELDQLKNGEIYSTLVDLFKVAHNKLDIGKLENIDDYIIVKPVTKTKDSVGGTLKDSFGNNITNELTWKQGFTIELSQEGRDIFRPFINEVNNEMLRRAQYSKAGISNTQQMLVDFLRDGQIKINTKVPEEVKMLDDLINMYALGNKGKLPYVYTTNSLNDVFTVRLAPNKKSYERIKEIDNQVKNLNKKINRVERQLEPYKRLQAEKQLLEKGLEEYTNIFSKMVERNPGDFFSLSNEEAKVALEYFNNELYKPVTDMLENRLKNEEKYIYMKPPSVDTLSNFKLAQRGFKKCCADLLQANIKTKGIASTPFASIDFSKAITKGNKYSLPITFKWKGLDRQQRFNLLAYMIERKVVSVNDFDSIGIKTFNDINKLDYDKILTNKGINNTNFVLGQTSDSKDFFNVSEWIIDDSFFDGDEVAGLFEDAMESVLNGNLVSNETFNLIKDTLSKDTAINFLSTNTSNLSQEGKKVLDTIRDIKGAITRNSKNITKQSSKHNIDLLEVLDSTYKTGIYEVNDYTDASKAIKEYLEESPRDINSMLEKDIDDLIHTSDVRNNQSRKLYNDLEIIKTHYIPQKDYRAFGWEPSRLRFSETNLDLFKLDSSDIYVTRNNSGQFLYSIDKPILSKDDFITISPEIKRILIRQEETIRAIEGLSIDIDNVNNTVDEFELALETNRNKDFLYNREGLEKSKQNIFDSWDQETNASMLANLKPLEYNKAFQDAISQNKLTIKTLEKNYKQITKDISTLQNDLFKLELKTVKDHTKELANFDKDIVVVNKKITNLNKQLKTKEQLLKKLISKQDTSSLPVASARVEIDLINTSLKEEMKILNDIEIKKDTIIKQQKDDLLELEKHRQDLKDMENKKESILLDKGREQVKLDKLEAQNNVVFRDTNVTNITETIAENIDNPNKVFVDSLSEADTWWRGNTYVTPMLENIKTVSLLMDNVKLSTVQNNIKELVDRIPGIFSETLTNLTGVQMAIHGSIGRLFKQIFNVEMSNWDVQGYMRHMLSPEQASLAAISKAIDGQASGISGELFGKNLKKLGIHRKYQGSAYDVNKAFGTELFNTNPVEATAIMLDLLPESFTLGGVFKNIGESGLLSKVTLTNEMTDKSILSLIDKKKKDIIKLQQQKNITPFQKKTISKLQEEIDIFDNYNSVLEKQKVFGKERIEANKINSDIDLELNKDGGLKESKLRLEEEIRNIDSTLPSTHLDTLNTELKSVKEQITQLESKKIKVTETSEWVEQNNVYRKQLEESANEISKMTIKDFVETDAYLHNNPMFGKEFTWVRKDMILSMRNSFDLVKRAAGNDAILNGGEYIKEFDAILESLEAGDKYAIHKGVIENIKRFSKNSSSGEFQSIFATIQKYITTPFKTFSLMSVGFHVRNLMTNYTNGYLAGINPADLHKGMTVARGEQKIFENILKDIDAKLLTGEYKTADSQLQMISKMMDNFAANGQGFKKVIWDDYFEMVNKGIIGNNQFNADTAELLNKITRKAKGKTLNKTMKNPDSLLTKGSDQFKKLMEFSFKSSKHMDDYAKISMYRLVRDNPKYKHLLENGMDAERFTKFTLFDYNNLTHAEEKYMKALFPFYTWARKNLEFQLRNIGTNIKQYNRLHDAINGWRQGMIGDDDNETGFYENYLPIWNSDGKITYLKFAPSYGEVDKFLDGSALVNSLTPIIKMPLEMITGYDFFTRREFETNGLIPGVGLGLNNILGTFNTTLQTLFQGHKPTYEQKKLAGFIGQKVLLAAESVNKLFSFKDSMSNDGLLNTIGNMFPSVFTQADIETSQYYNAKDRETKLQEALKHYATLNK